MAKIVRIHEYFPGFIAFRSCVAKKAMHKGPTCGVRVRGNPASSNQPRCLNWAGLSKTTRAERTKANCHSFRSREQSAQCPVLTLKCTVTTSGLNKVQMVVVRNVFVRNDTVNVVRINIILTSYHVNALLCF